MGLGEAYSLACALVWAIAVILFKRSGESLGPFALSLVKSTLALGLLALTLLLSGHWQPPALSWPALALSLFSGLLGIGVGDTLYFRALNGIGAARMAVAQTLYSPFVIVLSLLFLGEHLRPLQWLGVSSVVGGVAFMSRVGANATLPAETLSRGVMAAVASMLAMAAGIVIAKPLLEIHDFLWIVTLRLVGGVGGMLVLPMFRGGFAPLWAQYRRVRHWHYIVTGAFAGTYLSMLLWLAGYKYAKASVAAVLNESAALFILIFSAVFLHERLGRRQLGGALLALCGVGLVVAG